MHFIRLTKHEADDVMKFIVADLEAVEPLTKSLSLGRDEAVTFFKGLLREAVDSGVSYLVKTDDQQIIAARLSTFRTREDALRDIRHDAFHKFKTNLERAECLLWHLNQQFWAEAPPDIDKVYFLMAVVVDPRFRSTDLVDRLIHYNMDEIRTMGAQGLLANAAVFHNDSLLHKLGYRVMAEASHEFVLATGGEQVLQVSYSR
ncbi:hypothetical protein ANCCAN_15975 [Ancylostoma caninum]|uniref:N-acetyltransferase domain-containing protein n=1 Tax=Ancylostoma caninum TaxID=29170 RepID=A0A368G158_ANCCA|nr:hypothetical protein ANCCAN_15975 [Ancylostoma caninum]